MTRVDILPEEEPKYVPWDLSQLPHIHDSFLVKVLVSKSCSIDFLHFNVSNTVRDHFFRVEKVDDVLSYCILKSEETSNHTNHLE